MSDPDEPSSFDSTVDWGFLEHLVEHASERDMAPFSPGRFSDSTLRFEAAVN